MIRTRDFLLAIISIGFLIILLTYTVSVRKSVVVDGQSIPDFTESELLTVEAEVINPTLDRQSRIAWFKEQLGDILKQPSVTEVYEEETTEELSFQDTDAPPTEAGVVAGVMQCNNYQAYRGPWPTSNLTVVQSEGSRLFVTAIGSPLEQVLLVLPTRTYGAGMNCLPSDVVAIGQTGALIRNNEAAGYSVFTESTLIGYTLDGFPLYGFSSQSTDRCGGAVVDGTYRYYLSGDRNVILNCFVAPPVQLPS